MQGEEKQCLIDSKSENALLEMTKKTPKQETGKVAEIPQKEEIIQQIEQKKEEIMKEVQAKNKGIGEQVGDFFKGLLEMILNLLKGFDNFFKPQKQVEQKETMKKKEGIPRVEGKFEGGKIQAIIGGKEIAFASENITPFSGRQEPHLDGIAETLVLVDDKKYIIKDGKVFDWNGTMNVLSNEIKVQCGEKEMTQFNQSLKEVSKRGVENFNFRTFVTNTELLCCLIFLGEAKTNDFRDTKR